MDVLIVEKNPYAIHIMVIGVISIICLLISFIFFLKAKLYLKQAKDLYKCVSNTSQAHFYKKVIDGEVEPGKNIKPESK